jgi:hypothetical protein
VADATTSIQIVIEAQNRAQAALVDVQQQINALNQTITAGVGKTNELSASQQKFSGALEGTARQAASQAGQLGVLAASFGGVGLAIGATVGLLIAGAKAFVDIAESAARYQEQLDNLSKETGLSTGDLAGLKLAAAEVGKSFDNVQTSLLIFTRRIGEGAEGFQKLGVGIQDASGQIRPTGDILRDVIEKLEGIESPAQRAKAAFDLFGRSALTSLPALLVDLDAVSKKAEEMGQHFSPEMEKQLEAANVSFHLIQETIGGVKIQLAALAAVTLNPLLIQFDKFLETVTKIANSEQFKTVMSGLRFFAGGGFSAVPGQQLQTTVGQSVPVPRTPNILPPTDVQQMYQRFLQEIQFQSNIPGAIPGHERGGLGDVNGTRVLDISGPIAATAGAMQELKIQIDDALTPAEAFTRALRSQTSAVDDAVKLALNLRATIQTTMQSFVHDTVFGLKSVGEAFHNLIKSMIQGIADNLFQHFIKTAINVVAGAATGGTVQIPNSPGGGIGPMQPAGPMPSGGVNVTINANGHFIDRNSLQEFASETLIPVINDAMARGAYRGS